MDHVPGVVCMSNCALAWASVHTHGEREHSSDIHSDSRLCLRHAQLPVVRFGAPVWAGQD